MTIDFGFRGGDAATVKEGEGSRTRYSNGTAHLHALYEINRHYLRWLITSDRLGRNWSSLSLSEATLKRAAQCPFSLFNAAFECFTVWESIVEAKSERTVTAGGAMGYRPDQAAVNFAKAGLFFAWHMANGDKSWPVYARLLLGMHSRTVDALRCVSLPRFVELSDRLIVQVVPRWQTHDFFWTELIQAAQTAETHRLDAVRLLGCQLLAADMAGRT
jgi:hypothetical protein